MVTIALLGFPLTELLHPVKIQRKIKKLVGILNVEPASLRCKPYANIIHTVQILLISVLFKMKDRDASGILIIILIFKFVEEFYVFGRQWVKILRRDTRR